MKILIRYVLAELSKVFLVVLAGMTLVIMLVGVFKEALTQGLGVAQVLRLFPYVLPEALRFAVPGTVLFAACSVYGRMASSNELVAIKALGISPRALLWPAFALTFVLSLATVWLNDVAVSWGRAGIQRVIVESVEEIAYGMLRAQRSYRTPQFSINVKRVEGRRLMFPMLTFAQNGDTPPVTVTAQEAELRCDPGHSALTISFVNATVEVGDQMSMVLDTFERVVQLAGAGRGGDLSPSYLPMRVLAEEMLSQQAKICRGEQQMAARTAFRLTQGELPDLAGPDWQHDQATLAGHRHRLARLQCEPHRRWANGFSCLCFVVVGAPIAIRMRNSDFLTSFFLCFGPILIVYYPLLAYSVDRAKTGAMPPYVVWLGNGVLFLCGLWAMRKVLRY